ncbi:hypothetical protein LTR53_006787 [Teratosphaeriaceae sp. CCFEE 6253]|nr:hypothetical protein LTR53_006787 [Teratosphaeriaceae sp. CCFEE 6253]
MHETPPFALPFALRRLTVRALQQQPSRQLSTLRPQPTRVAAPRIAVLRNFHQSRSWLADADSKTLSEAQTADETVPTDAQPESAADALSEATGTTGESAEAAPMNDDGPALNTSSYDANEMPSSTSGVDSTASEPTPSQQSGDGILDKAQDLASNATASVSSAASTAAATVRSTLAGETPSPGDRSAPSTSSAYQPRDRDAARPYQKPQKAPSRILYIGNLFFEVTAVHLQEEFERLGAVTNVRVVTDTRGLSKGFGYVEFESQRDADRAVRELDQRVFQGRRMSVQYHAKREAGAPPAREPGAPRTPRVLSPPSKTLFIGNMSYQMSDRDLNDLFREIRNVLDVRVAIDRRSGQPRGFAHADFVDVASAERAKEVLEQKVIYGRQLIIDFSTAGAREGSTREPRGEGE